MGPRLRNGLFVRMTLNDKLALLNASLNLAAFAALATGWVCIRAGRREAHRKAMLTAVGISAVFLTSYLTRVAIGGTHTYPHEAAGRGFYLGMLASHVILAAAVPFFAGRAIFLAMKERFEEHRRLMRVGLPIWAYVSVTGVLVYLMLYRALGALPF